MERIRPQVPILILLYGFPGSGKTYFSRQFCSEVHAAHLEEDRVRHELFENPRFTKQENYAVARILHYMAGEFLGAGVSVVLDMNAARSAQRRALRELAKTHKASTMTIWLQVDPDTSFGRSTRRDRRKLDDRYAQERSVEEFKESASRMQHPETTEEYLVISGKHPFSSQFSGVIKKLADNAIVRHSEAMPKMVKPGLVNLVPHMQNRDEQGGPRSIVLN